MAPTTIDRTVDLAEFERRLQHIEDRTTTILQELEGFDRDLEELQAAGYPGFIDEIGNGIDFNDGLASYANDVRRVRVAAGNVPALQWLRERVRALEPLREIRQMFDEEEAPAIEDFDRRFHNAAPELYRILDQAVASNQELRSISADRPADRTKAGAVKAELDQVQSSLEASCE